MQEGGANPDQIVKVNWNYRNPSGQLDVKAASHALNGYDWKTGKLLNSYAQLKADGSHRLRLLDFQRLLQQ